MRGNDLRTLGRLLDASHRSLRENYEISTAAVEATVERLLSAGASGARLVAAASRQRARPVRARHRTSARPRARCVPARRHICSHRRAITSAQAVTTIASDSAASAPSSVPAARPPTALRCCRR